MGKIGQITLKDGTTLYVETEDVQVPDLVVVRDDLPEGAEEVTAAEKVKDALKMLKDTVRVAADTVNKGIAKTKPDEGSLELNIGFKAKSSPIPGLVGVESNVALKVTAKWKKEPTNPEGQPDK